MHGVIVWFIRNGVAANLLMCSVFIGGLLTYLHGLPVEIFPEVELDTVQTTVKFRGATPAEIEESVVIRIEEAIRQVLGVKKIVSRAQEGVGTVSAEVKEGYSRREVLDDIKIRVDAINTFPNDTEKPVISLIQRTRPVLSVVVVADMSEFDLRRIGEQIRDELSELPSVTQVELRGARPYEVSIEVSERMLQHYGLALEDVTKAVRASSVDLPAGAIKTGAGEILLRTMGQAYVKEDFENITLLARADGTRLALGDIAKIHDGFEDTPLYTRFNGRPCVLIGVTRTGEQNAIVLAKEVRDYLADRRRTLPEGLELHFWNDQSRIIVARMNTLLNSAWQGGLLVLILMAVFLRPAVAFWICLGIPVAFLGAIALMPVLGVTVNIISLFGFILVLGLVVDDAIVTGENIFTHVQRGEGGETAAIQGSLEVAVPVIFGVLTTIVAFVPLLMVGGMMGKFFMQIPAIVIPVLLFSLIESKLILPVHLKHLRFHRKTGPETTMEKARRWVVDSLSIVARHFYRPLLNLALRYRYISLSLFFLIALSLYALVLSNRVNFVFFPQVENELASSSLTMPMGTSESLTRRQLLEIESQALALRETLNGQVEPGETVINDIVTVMGAQGLIGGGELRDTQTGQSHLGEVWLAVELPEFRQLDITTGRIVKLWRHGIGAIPGARQLTFESVVAVSGKAIDIQLSGPDLENLVAATRDVRDLLREFPHLHDIADNFPEGKQEIQLRIRPEAETLNLNVNALGVQARQAFWGAEAQRVQRGRDDVRVMVRYPRQERASELNLKQMRIRTADRTEVPFSSVADITRVKSYSAINRVDQKRSVNVTASVDKLEADLEAIKKDLRKRLPERVAAYPGVDFSFEGEAREQAESFADVRIGALGVLFAIYCLLAIPFKSYLQPFVVMSVIPFGVACAILGHIIMGLSLSMMSIFGMLALSGVIVNDSLVLVDYINKLRRGEIAGKPAETSLLAAVRQAGVARFRAILLTSLTTFAGLIPIMFEKSTQAQFLIPMAVSLGWGIILGTCVTLLIVPIMYLILEDVRRGAKAYWYWQIGRSPATSD